MSLDSYTALKAQVADHLNKTNLTAAIPDFIRLAEAQMNRRLDCRQMECFTQIVIAGETAQLPCDFAGVKSFYIDDSPRRPLEQVSAKDLETVEPGRGKPSEYAVIGGKFRFNPYPGTGDAYTAKLWYRQRIPALSAAVPSNWLLEDHPDAYLYGALTQSAPYLRDDERLGVWASLFENAVRDINRDDVRQTFGAPFQIKPSQGAA